MKNILFLFILPGKLTIDISRFAPGMYYVQLIGTDSKSLRKSFIKE
jgi:hypothetical protein